MNKKLLSFIDYTAFKYLCKSHAVNIEYLIDFSGKLSMGPGTHEIPVDLFEQNRKRLADRLRAKEGLGNAIILLQGGSEIPFYDTDVSYIFRQVYIVKFTHIFFNEATRSPSGPVVFHIFAGQV